jgi:replicative DNA helicase
MKEKIKSFELALQNSEKSSDGSLLKKFKEIVDYFENEISEQKEEIEALEEQILEIEETSIIIPKHYQTVSMMSTIEEAFSNLENIQKFN